MAFTVLQDLQSKGIYIEATCGGAGTCGKCRVLIDGKPCLACQTLAEDAGEVIVEKTSNDFEVLTATSKATNIRDGASYGLAVDIGTTTIAFALVDLEKGSVAFSYGVVNSQRKYGADVISRIKAANEGQLAELTACVVKDITDGIRNMPCGDIKAMVVAGNTTMLHILLGESCETLGVFPFDPVFIDLQRRPFEEIFGEKLIDCEVTILPGISTYVGADIAAGVLYGYALEGGVECLLVDLGTNGELARFAGGHYVVGTATAAGPAFEGGNISCGTGSIPGAISKAVYNTELQKFEYETIGGVLPYVGVCGSGLLDIAAQLVLHGFIDEAGSIEGDFILTQKDIRELQLAKSAVRAGIEILLLEHELEYNQVDKIYLAGGFGHSINLESAFILGILPKEWRGKVEAIGNSSLAGCIRVLIDPDSLSEIVTLTENAREINLSAHPKFNEMFMDYMLFGE